MRIKKYLALGLALVLMLNSVTAAFAAEKITTSDTKVKYQWQKRNADYYFTADGRELSGWQLIDEKWYFFDVRPESYGKLLTGWQKIDDRWYYLTPAGEPPCVGRMYQSEITPDGYYVNADGAWELGGKVVEEAGGIITHIEEAGTGFSPGEGRNYGGTRTQEVTGDEIISNDDDIGVAQTDVSSEESSLRTLTSEVKSALSEVTRAASKKVFASQLRDEEEMPDASPNDAEYADVEPASPNDAEYIDDYEDKPVIDDVNENSETEKANVRLTAIPFAMSFSSPNGLDPSEEYEVEWYVHFTDKENHAMKFANDQHGHVMNGDSIYIGFCEEMIDDEGNIWNSVQSPGLRTIWGPGVNIIYIEYEKVGRLPDPVDPYEELKEELGEWIQTAKEADAEITGEDEEDIPISRVVCASDGKANLRLLSAANQIYDTEPHEVYVIAENCYPTGTILKATFGTFITYSHDKQDEIEIEGKTYSLHMFILQKSYDTSECDHHFETVLTKDAACLIRGTTKYECTKCKIKKTVYSAPTGHTDADKDSICDKCGYRVTADETLGDIIKTKLKLPSGEKEITWTLVDQGYDGGCLYVANDGIDVAKLGGYEKEKEYQETELFRYLSYDFPNQSSVNGDNLKLLSEDGTTAFAQMLSYDAASNYRDIMGSGDYVTHTTDSDNLIVLHDDGTTSLIDPESGFDVRLSMLLAKPLTESATVTKWHLGDQVTKEIDGEDYTFTCVDENYSDYQGNHTLSALFLCDTVLPSDYKGETVWYYDTEGHYVSKWVPGPIAIFGNNNDYKFSNIRAFLDAQTVFSAADVIIGVPNSYIGSTAQGRYSQTTDENLESYSIGYQKLNARLFILNMEEALRYKDYLWKFNGSDTENPQEVVSSTCNSYWLRTPNGTNYDCDETDLAYVVDLVSGNIHPEFIKPQGTADEYIQMQTTVGTRPAFVLPNY